MFVLFVTWCMLGVVGTVATLLFFPWSVPFALIAIVAGAYAVRASWRAPIQADAPPAWDRT